MTSSASVVDTPVLHPASARDVRDIVRDALASNEPLRVCGAGTWARSGPPVEATRTLSLAGMRGIVAYVPGDLTITALAGTTLAELSHTTAANGQWLGLDPAGDRHGTIGATVATASAGPLAHAFGTPRDMVLGIEAVTGYGELVTPGGRVVKNVAGFDLVRLFTGSWGTLGPITSVTLRLRAIPVHDSTLAMPIDADADVATMIRRLRESTLSLLALEWIDSRAANVLGIGDGRDQLLLRVGGNDAFVRGQHALLATIAPCIACDPAIWGALAALDRDATAVVRISGSVSGWPSRVARLRAELPASAEVLLHGSIARGIVRMIVRGDASASRAAMQAGSDGEQRNVERLPEAWWSDEGDVFSDGLAGRIRRAFDPALLCNRRHVPHA